MNFGQLRSAVYERTGLASTDPSMTDANMKNLVNAALHRFEVANPRGWDWLRYDGSFSLVSSTESYTFSTIDSTNTIMKVIEVRVDVGSGFRDPLPRVSKGELLGYYSDTIAGTPEAHAIDGRTMWVRPIPDNTYNCRFTAVKAEPDLSNDSDSPVVPAIFHSAIIEKAAELAFRRVQNRLGAEIAEAAFNEWVGQARSYSKPWGGPGHVRDTAASYRGAL